MDCDQWFESLAVGTIVHEDRGYGKFVRCEVREGVWHQEGENRTGRHLVALDLVGEWEPQHLPRWVGGKVISGEDARRVLGGSPYRPHPTHLWECPGFGGKGIDPATREPVPLTVAPAISEQVKNQRRQTAANAAMECLAGDPFVRLTHLQQAKSVLQDAIEEDMAF